VQRKRYLFVCVNRRAEDNPKGSCAAKESEEVYRALKEEVAARGLAKLEAHVCTSSCLDQCDTGVTILVEPDHFFYGRVTVGDCGWTRNRPTGHTSRNSCRSTGVVAAVSAANRYPVVAGFADPGRDRRSRLQYFTPSLVPTATQE